MPRQLQLLAPARDLATAREAILHGADAVYIGAPSHGARSRATNTLEDIRALVEFAAPFGVKVYVTVNTLIYDSEIKAVEAMVKRLYEIGVDALIVQDMALLEMNLPPIALHASTQCDTRTPEKARFLADAGFTQIVVARELSLGQLRAICEAVPDVPVEAFVHGALCVSYSGDCRASLLATGRSANRGECAQMCRLPYDLIDGRGRVVGRGRHYLSLRDMCRIDRLADMADAGVSSFKIEGRLKDIAYVKEVTAAYRQALDRLIDEHPDRYCRPSRGRTILSFEPDIHKAFNREFTDYFLDDDPDGALSTPESPKAKGEPIGEVVACKGLDITARLTRKLNNGDGLTWVTPDGKVGGGRINRVEGQRLVMASPASLPRGTALYLSFDRLRSEMLNRPTARRVIDIDVNFSLLPDGKTVRLTALVADGSPLEVTVAAEVTASPAKNSPEEYRRRTLGKLGDTIFNLRDYTDCATDSFVPASELSDLRRRLVDTLMATLLATRPTERRNMLAVKPKTTPRLAVTHLTERDNVANALARRFYLRAGAESIRLAFEVKPPEKGETPIVMETRYCLRRELGACLRTPGATDRLPEPLTLRVTPSGATLKSTPTYDLRFDCARCCMQLIAQTC